MGYYIQTPMPQAKAHQLGMLYDAESYSGTFDEIPDGKVAVCVVESGPFDAAGILYDAQEFAEFMDPSDDRSKTLLLLDKEKAVELCPHVADKLAE